MKFIITVFSKNQNYLLKFFKFLKEKQPKIVNKNSYLIILKQKSKKQNRYVFSILKSPHVNKTAQEHFGYRVFSKQILMFSYKPYKFFFFFKKIQSYIFPDIKFRVSTVVSNQTDKNLSLNFFNPYNFRMESSSKINFQGKAVNYLKMFDNYGELYFKI